MTDREFRALDAAHAPAVQELRDYAFDAASGPTGYESAEDTPDRLGREFGVFEDGDLRSVCTHHDFTARVRSEWLPMAGLAGVATPPEHRREGLVTALVRESLARWRGAYPISALWPFEYPYYRQFGWALANTAAEYTCPPGVLSVADAGDAGRMRRLDPDDWERLRDVHEAHGADLGLTLRRDEAWWRRRVFRSIGGQRRYVSGLERDGRVDGYLAYTVERGDGGQVLRAGDLAFRDRAAFRRLLSFLADHDSQVDRVRLYRPDGRSLFDAVADPGALDCSVSPGAQVRIVDVAAALSALPFPPDAAATLRLAVTDDHAPWNDGVFDLRVADGTAECEPLGADVDADAAVDVGTLSQLVVGARTAADARRGGGLDASPAVAERLGALFPSRTVYLRDYF